MSTDVNATDRAVTARKKVLAGDEFIQCPHEVIRATCVGCCNCPCDHCAPSRGEAIVKGAL